MSWSSGSHSRHGAASDVMRIYEMLTPKPRELVTNHGSRRFVREGEIDVYNPSERRVKHRYFFLFNDVLLLTKKEGSKRFWLKVYISLRTSLRVEDVPDTASPYRDEFRLYAPKKTFIFFARAEEMKHSWLRDIRAAINGEFGGRTDAIPSTPFSPNANANAHGAANNGGAYDPYIGHNGGGNGGGGDHQQYHSNTPPSQSQYGGHHHQQSNSKAASTAATAADLPKLSGNIGRIEIAGVESRRGQHTVGDDVEEEEIIASIAAVAPARDTGKGFKMIDVDIPTTQQPPPAAAAAVAPASGDPFEMLAKRNAAGGAPDANSYGIAMPSKPLPNPPAGFQPSAPLQPTAPVGGAPNLLAILQPTSAPLQPTPVSNAYQSSGIGAAGASAGGPDYNALKSLSGASSTTSSGGPMSLSGAYTGGMMPVGVPNAGGAGMTGTGNYSAYGGMYSGLYSGMAPLGTTGGTVPVANTGMPMGNTGMGGMPMGNTGMGGMPMGGMGGMPMGSNGMGGMGGMPMGGNGMQYSGMPTGSTGMPYTGMTTNMGSNTNLPQGGNGWPTM